MQPLAIHTLWLLVARGLLLGKAHYAAKKRGIAAGPAARRAWGNGGRSENENENEDHKLAGHSATTRHHVPPRALPRTAAPRAKA
jgi:hypothetical protein